MPINLRTRLFLVVAAVLGVAIAVSALLSRQATLFEVREFVSPDPSAGAEPLLDRAAADVATGTLGAIDQRLSVIERESSRPVLVFEDGGALVGASNAALRSARVRSISADGTFEAEITDGNVHSIVATRGAPTRQVEIEGRRAWIMLLPSLDEDVPSRIVPTRRWMWTTLATALIAVPLVFAVSRRILGPIGALTAAARAMQQGDLEVRVPAGGGDELGELARTFNAMAARLAENERQRRQMVSDVAHELRSPVTNLRCTLEAIQDGLVPADPPSIDALHEETLFLQRLIADLQDLALADAGQLTLRLEALDAGAVLRRAVTATLGVGGAPPTQVDIDPLLPRIRGDADRLEQVFRNLLANARTHTPSDGTVHVRAFVDGVDVCVAIADTGVGIARDQLPHVFERFYRADPSRTRSTGGAGLGLAIVRHLVQAHGGAVSAASDGRDRGATFTVRLPAER